MTDLDRLDAPNYPPPKPDWGRPGETWRVEPESLGWTVVDIDGLEVPCGVKRCGLPAAATLKDRGWCVRHLREGGMWVHNNRVVSWRLSR